MYVYILGSFYKVGFHMAFQMDLVLAATYLAYLAGVCYHNWLKITLNLNINVFIEL